MVREDFPLTETERGLTNNVVRLDLNGKEVLMDIYTNRVSAAGRSRLRFQVRGALDVVGIEPWPDGWRPFSISREMVGLVAAVLDYADDNLVAEDGMVKTKKPR